MKEKIVFMEAEKWASKETLQEYWGFVPQYVAIVIDEYSVRVYGVDAPTLESYLSQDAPAESWALGSDIARDILDFIAPLISKGEYEEWEYFG